MSRIWKWIPLLAVSAFGAELQLYDLLQRVENRYNRAQTLEVLFTEVYKGPGQPRRTESGRLQLRKPGRMRWEYSKPAGKLFVSDGSWLWLYTPTGNRVEKMKLKETDDMRAPLAFLLGRLNFSKEFRTIRGRPVEGGTLIDAEPATPNLPYTHVEFLVGEGYTIRRVKVTGHDGSILDFQFENEKINPRLDASLFRFQPPPGAEVVVEGSQ